MRSRHLLKTLLSIAIILLSLILDLPEGGILAGGSQDKSAPDLAFALQEDPPPSLEGMHELIGRWEGELRFGGEGPNSSEFTRLEVTDQCSETAYCLIYDVPGPPLTKREMSLDLESESEGEGLCFSEFVFEPSVGTSFPLMTLCLAPAAENEILIDGSGPLTWISGQMTREAFSCERVVGISEQECQALVALYDSTGGPNWTNNSGWLVTNDVCRWYGVNCQMELGKVTHIMLGDNGLQGTLPPEIGSLQLNWFSLADNAIGGSLPDNIGDLRVQNLVLKNTDLTGPLPLSMAKMSTIQVFDFSGTNLCVPDDPGIQAWIQSGPLFVSSELNCSETIPGGNNQGTQQDYSLAFEEKHELIQYLDSPPITVLDRDLFPPEPFAASWGYDEEAAEDLLQDLKHQYEQHQAGLLTPEEAASLEAQLVAFDRLLLSERALQDTYKLYVDTAYATADSAVSITALFMGFKKAYDLAEEQIARSGSTWLLPMLRLVNKSIDVMWDSIEELNESVFGGHGDEDLNSSLRRTKDWIYIALIQLYDSTDFTSTAYTNIMRDESLRIYVSADLLRDYFRRTQPLIDDGVKKVQQGAGEQVTTGSLADAELHYGFIEGESRFYTDFMERQHEDFRQAINYVEIAQALGDISTATGLGIVVGGPLSIVSRVFSAATNTYDGYCQVSHLVFLENNLNQSHYSSFDAARPLDWQEPTHCNFDYWPSVSKNPEYSRSKMATEISLEVPSIVADPPDTLADTPIGRSLLAYREQLAMSQANVVAADPEALANSLDALFAAEETVRAEMSILLAASEANPPTEQYRRLRQGKLNLALQSSLLYASMVGFYSDPANEEGREALIEQLDQVENVIEQLESLPWETVSETNATPRTIIAQVSSPELILGQGSPVLTITLANVGGESDTGLTLDLVEDAKVVATMEALEIPAEGRLIVELPLPKMEEGDHLYSVQLRGQAGEIQDMRTLGVDVPAPDVLAAASKTNKTTPENVELTPTIEQMGDRGAVADPEQTEVEVASMPLSRILLAASGVVLFLAGGGMMLVGKRRRNAG